MHVAGGGLPDGGRRTERITETIRNRPDLVLLPVLADGTTTPAGGLTAIHGDLTMGIIDTVPDVVIRPSTATPDHTFEVMLPGAGALRTEADWRELPEILTTVVVARADLLRARTALATMLRLARITPPPAERLGSLEDDLEELRIGAVEVAELEAGTTRPSPAATRFATGRPTAPATAGRVPQRPLKRNEPVDGGTRPGRRANL